MTKAGRGVFFGIAVRAYTHRASGSGSVASVPHLGLALGRSGVKRFDSQTSPRTTQEQAVLACGVLEVEEGVALLV